MRGFLGFLVTAPTFVNLRNVQERLAVVGVPMQVRPQDFDGIVGLAVLPDQQGVARANSRVCRVLGHRLFAGL